MQLRKFTDNEFDNFIKKKFEQAPAPAFDPAAWAALEAKSAGRFNKLWVANGIILLILTLITLWISLDSDQTILDKNSSQVVKLEEQSSDHYNVVSKRKERQDLNNKTTGFSESTNNSTQSTARLAPSGKSADQDRKTSAIPEHNTIQWQGNREQGRTTKTLPLGPGPTTINNKSAGIIESGQVRSSGSKPRVPEKGRGDSGIRNSQEKDMQNITSAEIQVQEQSRTGNYIDNKYKQQSDNLPEASSYKPGKEESSKKVVEAKTEKYMADSLKTIDSPVISNSSVLPKNRKPRRWTVGIGTNLEYATVNFNDFSKPAPGLKLRASYQLTERISLQAGLNLTTKKYEVNNKEDYTLPSWILDNQGWPDGVDATCNVLEVPLGFRYDLLKQTRGNFYTSLSGNSYLMNREKYLFQMEGYSGSNVPVEEWEVRGKNRHLMRVLEVAGGYERLLGNRSSINLELYWQQTFGGIGAYQVNFSSIGTAFMFNYKL